jgi:hypothetical protein
MYELVSINNTIGGNRHIDHIPFMNVDNYQGPQKASLVAWAKKYNAKVEQDNKLFSALNAEQAQPQEEIRHIGAGSYNLVTKIWEHEGIAPVANAEENFTGGAGEYDPVTKTWK